MPFINLFFYRAFHFVNPRTYFSMKTCYDKRFRSKLIKRLITLFNVISSIQLYEFGHLSMILKRNQS
jgi:hypothetical protein